MVSFSMQKILSLIRSHLFQFLFSLLYKMVQKGCYCNLRQKVLCPTDERIKKMWYICTMEYSLVIKRNETGSFVMMWMNLQSVIQSEVSQKEKNKYHILMHTYGLQKNGTNERIWRGGIEMQIQRMDMWTWGDGRGRMNSEIRICRNTLNSVQFRYVHCYV